VSDNPNQITIDNSVLILVDHQPWVAFAVKSIDASLLVNNLEGIAASAKALDVPVILTTVGASGGPLEDPPIKGLADVIPDVDPIDGCRRTPGRTSAKPSRQRVGGRY
jgi:nicotinamidase-related amidase